MPGAGNRAWRPRYRYRDEAAVGRLVRENQGLVFDVLYKRARRAGGAQRLNRNGLERTAQEGYLALWRAADTWREDWVSPLTGTPVKFSTYACRCIARALIALERPGHDGGSRFDGRWFSGSWPAGLPRPRVFSMPRVWERHRGLYDESTTEHDPADPGPGPPDRAAAGELPALVDRLGGEEPRLALVVRRRFLDPDRRTLDQVGRELGLTRERVRQLERDALSLLRERMGG
jgi:hypothetical protein